MTKDGSAAPALAGIHHVKLPVRDLARSREWYETRLGYAVEHEFVEDGEVMGVVMAHGNGGPSFALRLNPGFAAAAGFDYFAIGVPSKVDVDYLAARLTELGDTHAGVQETPFGWVLPQVHDPDGHEVRFYVDTRRSL
jgi:catechol 2,3-dioxygenase-like lactoylglutathione lyase family enzyme